MIEEDKEFEGLPKELQETLSQWAYITVNELKLSMAAKRMHLGDLYKSFTWKLFYDGNGMPTKVTIGYLWHGRFVDMGVGKGQKIGEIKSNREVWRYLGKEARAGRKARKPKKWYSPVMFYEYQRAAEILAGKYGIELPARFEKLWSGKIAV